MRYHEAPLVEIYETIFQLNHEDNAINLAINIGTTSKYANKNDKPIKHAILPQYDQAHILRAKRQNEKRGKCILTSNSYFLLWRPKSSSK